MSILGFGNTYADNIPNENLTQQVTQQGTANSYEFSKNDYLDLSHTNQPQNATVLTSGKQKITVNKTTNNRFAILQKPLNKSQLLHTILPNNLKMECFGYIFG